MKDKYIEEKYPVYFVWGERVDGHVDIATTSDDTIATVSQEHAEKLIQDRNDLVRRLCDMAQAFDRSSPEEFNKFWYGSCLAQPEPVLPPNYIDAEHTGQDQELLKVFYKACLSEGGTADEITLRGLKAALAQPKPETSRLRYCDVHGQQPENAWGCPECVREMRHQLAQPEPVAPTASDVTELFYRHMGEGSEVGFENAIAEALARYGTPTIQSVPVSERLPGAEDCAPWPDEPDATNWCWAAKCVDGGWEWTQLSMLGLGSDTLGRIIAGGGWTHWAPHWALLVPTPANNTKEEN